MVGDDEFECEELSGEHRRQILGEVELRCEGKTTFEYKGRNCPNG